MKGIAVVLNIGLLAGSILLTITEGVGDISGWFVVFFFLIFAAPLFSLIVLASSNDGSWLELYLRRKVLEEKRKISELQK